MDLTQKTTKQLKAMMENRLDEAKRIREDAGEAGRWTKGDKRRFDDAMEAFHAANDELQNRKPAGPVLGARAGLGFDGDDGTMTTGRGGESAMDNRIEKDYPDIRVKRDWTGREAFGEYLRGVRPAYEYRAGSQTVGSSGQGGVLSPTGFRAEVFSMAKAFDGLRRTRARIFQTDHGRDITLPGIDDTANKAKIVAEGSTISSGGGASTNLAFTAVTSETVAYQSGPVKTSFELIEDAEVDITSLIAEKFAERIGRATAEHFATRSSTETEGPHGLTNVSTGAVTLTAGSTNLTISTLRSLYFSVDSAWRPNAEWAVSDDAMEAIWDLQDGSGRPLVSPSNRAGAPELLLGKPIRIVPDLPSINSTGNLPIFFGDMSAFMIRDVNTMRFLRLDQRYAEEGNVGFIAWTRHDSRPLFSSTYSSSLRPIRALKTVST